MAYWDSTRVIPPADLPRIRVIDRTMVGLGLISSEELAGIHRIGDEFAGFKNDHSRIDAAGERAVVQSRKARAELRKQKKEEAVARRAAHAQAVAHRRATDIVYLGRGVSRGLADRKSNVEKLSGSSLPVLATPADLATALELTIQRLRWLSFHNVAPAKTHYVYFDIPKKSGGTRRLSAPHRNMAAAQRWVLDNVLSKVDPHDAAHGFVPGRSILTNAMPHVGTDVVVNADLKDFFPTITFPRVEGLLRSFGYSGAVATIMALICTECPREEVRYAGQSYFAATGPRALPQGACTSPAISNLIARHLDLRLSGMAAKLGWVFTRYADDITFSASGEAAEKIGYVLARIRHIADDEGFVVNESKTRVLRSSTRQSVTGIVVNDVAHVPRRTVRKLRAILHNARESGGDLVALNAQNRDGREDFVAWLGGMISFVAMVDASQGLKLRCQFESIVQR